jgi:hypothetical protein
MAAGSRGEMKVRYRFQASGTYFVGLLHNGHLVASHPLHITL